MRREQYSIHLVRVLPDPATADQTDCSKSRRSSLAEDLGRLPTGPLDLSLVHVALSARAVETTVTRSRRMPEEVNGWRQVSILTAGEWTVNFAAPSLLLRPLAANVSCRALASGSVAFRGGGTSCDRWASPDREGGGGLRATTARVDTYVNKTWRLPISCALEPVPRNRAGLRAI